MRTFLTVALLVSASVMAGARDDKPGVAEQMKTIQKQAQEDQQALIKKYSEATDAKEKVKISNEISGLRTKQAEKLLALASENLKDPAALDAALTAMRLGQGATATKAADLIATNFADSPKLAPLVPQIGSTGPAGEKLLAAIAAKATDKSAKGAALYYLAAGKLESADYPRTGTPLPVDKQVAAFKEAEAGLKAVAKEFGDVELAGRGGKTESVAKAVEGQLYFLNNLTIGKVLPDSAVEDLDGKKVKISDYRGKVVALDVWATWCGPCRAMIPHEREMVEKRKDKPFALISLSADAKKETLTEFLVKEPMPWVHWWNGAASGAALEAYKIRFYPTIYVLDEKGVIRFKHVRGEKMDEAVDTLLKEIKSKG